MRDNYHTYKVHFHTLPCNSRVSQVFLETTKFSQEVTCKTCIAKINSDKGQDYPYKYYGNKKRSISSRRKTILK